MSDRTFLVGEYGFLRPTQTTMCPIATAYNGDPPADADLDTLAELFDAQFPGDDIGHEVSEDRARTAWTAMMDDLDGDSRLNELALTVATELGWDD